MGTAIACQSAIGYKWTFRALPRMSALPPMQTSLGHPWQRIAGLFESSREILLYVRLKELMLWQSAARHSSLACNAKPPKIAWEAALEGERVRKERRKIRHPATLRRQAKSLR